jgi:hypothetical protein
LVVVCHFRRRYGEPVKAGILLILLVMAGCDRAVNTFEVNAPGAASAELQLCGKATSLKRSGDKLTVTRAISCEGEGVIIVHFPNRAPVSCHIGYVTPGAVQSFQFKVDDGQCGPSDA